MYAVIVTCNGQPIRALTTPRRDYARRLLRQCKSRIRTRLAHHDSQYTVQLITPRA